MIFTIFAFTPYLYETMNKKPEIYKPKNHVRIVTAASLFDGHDAAINIMRRIIQATGVEVIHLGHDRSVKEIVDCAIQEDVQSIAITIHNGPHYIHVPYMKRLKSANVDCCRTHLECVPA